MTGRNPRYNASGSHDPTAYEALKPIMQEESKIEKKVNKFIDCIDAIASLAGFEVTGGGISIKDKKSGIRFKRQFFKK